MVHLISSMTGRALAVSSKQSILALLSCLAIFAAPDQLARGEVRESQPVTANAGEPELQQPGIILPVSASEIPSDAKAAGPIVERAPRPLRYSHRKARRTLPPAPNEFLRTHEPLSAMSHSERSAAKRRISSAQSRDHLMRQLNFQTTQDRPATAAPEPPSAPGATEAPAKKTDPCAALADRPFSDFGIDITMPTGNAPEDHASGCWESINAADGSLAGDRCWTATTYNWNATCFCHRPLYFEEINLERYGYGCCEALQPAASAAHFFATIPVLPYCIGTDCPGECIYTLGHYRPGSCPPWQCHWPRWSTRGALAQAGVWTGLVFLIP
jgi:hypothetical protein